MFVWLTITNVMSFKLSLNRISCVVCMGSNDIDSTCGTPCLMVISCNLKKNQRLQLETYKIV